MADEKLLSEIGKRINARRKELNITQEKLAEKMDVSIQMISNLEQGKKAIRPENLVKLCNALDVSADHILRGVHSDAEISEISIKYAKLTPENQKLVEMLIDSLIK